MRRNLYRITVICSLFAIAAIASAQTRKPGLWDLTTIMTWQQSPFPTGANGAPAAVPHTVQVCLTQQQIDKYGAILPQTRGCQIANLVNNPTSMTADMVCTGHLNGKATLHATWTDSEHATGGMHFIGSMQVGADSKPIEWTTASTSVYKGSDCGSVKPNPMPDK